MTSHRNHNAGLDLVLRVILLVAFGTLSPTAILATPPSNPDTPLEVTPKKLVLDADEEIVVTITHKIENFDKEKLKISKASLVTVVKGTSPQTINVKAINRGLTVTEAKEKFSLVYDESGLNLTAELDVTVRPRAIEDPTMVIAGASTATDKVIKGKIRLVQGQQVPIRLRYKGVGGYVYMDKLSLKSVPANVVTEVAGTPPSLKADNLSEEEVKITVVIKDPNEAAPARPALDFAVQVESGIDTLQVKEGSQITMTEGESRTLGVTVLGPGGIALPAKLANVKASSADPATVNVSREDDGRITLTARSAPADGKPIKISFSTVLPTGETKEFDKVPVDVVVVGKHGQIEFRPAPQGFLLPNGNVSTTVVVRNREGQEQPTAGVEFKLEKEADAKWVTLEPEGRTVKVHWADPPDGDTSIRPAQVRVKVTAFAKSLEPIHSEFLVRLRVVKGFTPLTVKLDVMNHQMARDLYGKQMADEFHVLLVRLFNNLKDDRTGRYIGDSILAYSSSIEVAVGMEKKFRENRESHFKQVLTGKESATEDAAQVAKIQEAKNGAITRDQLRLDEMIEERKKAEDDLQAARLRLVDAHRKALASKAAYLQSRTDSYLALANEGIENYNAAVRAWDAAKENLSVAESQIAGLRAGILNNASSIYDVNQAYAQYGDPSTTVDDGQWRPVNRSDLEHIAFQDATENPAYYADQAPTLMAKLNDKDIKEDASAAPSAESPVPLLNALPKTPQCLGTATYRPFTFEMMVNTVDRRDGRSFRSKLFKTLESLGTAASFFTALAVPGSGSDFPLGLDKYRNLLIPNAEKLIPNYKEQHRQNIVSQAMKLIEEIPFGSDINRVIFVPKKKIEGMLRGHDLRISEVCTFYFKVDVAIIQKAGSVQAGNAP